MYLSRNFSTLTLCLILLHPCTTTDCVGVTLLTIWGQHSIIHRADYSQIYKALFLLLWEQDMFPLTPSFSFANFSNIRPSFCVCVLSCSVVFTLCDPMDCSSPGSSIHEIFQTRVQEQLSFSPPEDLPDPGIEPVSLALASRFITAVLPGKPSSFYN